MINFNIKHNDKFYAYLEGLNATYVELAGLLADKARALEADDLLALDDIINDEQVYLLKTRGFDQNLAAFKKQTGYKGDTLNQIIEELPEGDRPRFKSLHDKLSASLDTAKAFNDKCQRLTQVKLHGLEVQLQNAPGKQPGKNTASAEKAKKQEPRQGKPFIKSI